MLENEKPNKLLFLTKNNKYNRITDRLEFIKLLLDGTDLEPMIELNMNHIIKDNHGSDIRDFFQKKVRAFKDIINKIGGKLLYIKSGTTGHTFKGISIPDTMYPDMVINYGVKIVAYPKNENYGSIYDVSRPENAELIMLKILSYFVIQNQTPHIVLPIGTFNTKIHPFIALTKNNIVSSKKYEQFVKRYENDEFFEDVSILISEWADGGDLLEYLRENFNKLTVKEWRVIFFQILSALTIIQTKYPTFRHNDLKANNILLQKISQNNNSMTYKYTINNQDFFVPNIGLRCKIWDFDFACIPGIVENAKVNADWTNRINVRAQGHKYYDVHYFFNTLTSKGFINNFFGLNSNDKPNVPKEVTDFIKRVIPNKLRKGEYVTERGRLLLDFDDLYKIKNLINKTPEEIINNDPFFAKMRNKN
jgi:hypothetical protein